MNVGTVVFACMGEAYFQGEVAVVEVWSFFSLKVCVCVCVCVANPQIFSDISSAA